jgi:transposase
VVAAQVPGLQTSKPRHTLSPSAEALLQTIETYRDRAAKAGRTVDRVVLVYEAGYSGFWLARWLARHGVETFVIQPSSVPVDRRVRRAKSDGIDAELLLRMLLAWLRGEPRVCSMVPIPTEADEDARRSVRERQDLLGERMAIANGITSILATLDVRGYDPLRRDRRQRLEEARTALGDPLPPQSRAENFNLLKKADLCSRSNRWCAAICLSTARQRHQIYLPGQRIG